jgi:hypothetical protein
MVDSLKGFRYISGRSITPNCTTTSGCTLLREITCHLSEADGWRTEVLSVSGPAVRLVRQRLLILATGLPLLDGRQSRFGYQVLSYVDDFWMSFHREGVDQDGLSTGLTAFGQAVVALWAN